MKVVFLKNVPGVGQPPDVKEVSDAYARNFLLPGRLAAVASATVIAQHQQRQQRQVQIQAAVVAAADQELTRLQQVTVRLTAPASDQGTLFAAIHGQAVIAALRQQYRVKLTKVQIEPADFKQTGSQPALIRWPHGPTCPITIIIEHDQI